MSDTKVPEPTKPANITCNDGEAAKVLLDKGLLFELNRQVLHPFGYALGVRFTDEGEDILGEFLGFFIIKTKDPAGMEFGDESFKDGYQKLMKFLAEEGIATLDARKKELGYRVQELSAFIPKE